MKLKKKKKKGKKKVLCRSDARSWRGSTSINCNIFKNFKFCFFPRDAEHRNISR